MDGQMIQWMNRRDFPEIIIELSLYKQSVENLCRGQTSQQPKAWKYAQIPKHGTGQDRMTTPKLLVIASCC